MTCGKYKPLSGFTLVELLVVMAIVALLLMVAVPQYSGSVGRSQEAVLKHNLAITRDALEKYYSDKGRYPADLQVLVTEKYLRSVPHDPVLDRSDAWLLIPPTGGGGSGVYDIRSGSEEKARDGSRYSEW